MVGAECKILDRDVGFQSVPSTVKIPLPESGKVEDGFAQGFTGNGAGMYTDSADHFLPLDDAYFLSELGGLNGGLLTGRPRPDNQQVVLSHQDLKEK
jgi:hypothetical protein